MLKTYVKQVFLFLVNLIRYMYLVSINQENLIL